MNRNDDTVRVFVAIDLPEAAKETLRQAVADLQDNLQQGIHWVRPEGIHLTLKFLGDVSTARVGDIQAAMDKAAREFEPANFRLALSGLGVFPNPREPRVLWAGVSGDMEALEHLQGLTDGCLEDAGFARERRPFRPHLTLGRVRDQVAPEQRRRIGQAIQQATPPQRVEWQVGEVHLIRSTLTPGGAIYDSIGSASLKGKGGAA
ncbi:MAG: RNA 2',3'-cyclic phosphodiesterase [Chloroflexota bacterium]|nr:RNA 2',3'-cyclic phosphodiesterase [Chloroflexota bacterium]